MKPLDRLASWWLGQKIQTDRSEYLRASLRPHEGAGIRGAKRRPTHVGSMLGRFQGWVYAAAMLNARAFAQVPLRLYARRPDGLGLPSLSPSLGLGALSRTKAVPASRRRYLVGDGSIRPSKGVMNAAAQAGEQMEEVLNHPLLDLLADVNLQTDGFQWSVLRKVFLQITGNEYHLPIVNGAGVPNEIWTLPSQWVEIIPDRDNAMIEGYAYGRPPDVAFFPRQDVLHLKTPHPEDLLYGQGWVAAAVTSVDLLASMDEYELALFDNMARPDWGIFISEMLGDHQWDRMMTQIDQNLRGSRRGGQAGRPYVFEGGADAKPLQFSPRELAFSDGEERKIEAVAAISGVPVSKLKSNDPNLSNAEMGDYGWMKDTISPMCRADEEWLNAGLVKMFNQHNEGLFLAYDDPVPQDVSIRASVNVSEVTSGIKTINEARADAGLPPLVGGEELRINGQTLESLDRPADPFGFFGDSGPIPPGSQDDDDDADDETAEERSSGVTGRKRVDDALRYRRELAKLLKTVFARWTFEMAKVIEQQADAAAEAADADWRKNIRDEKWLELIDRVNRPFVEAAFEVGGEAGMRRVSGGAFDVSNPEVQRFVDREMVRLRSTVQGSTEHQLSQLFGRGLDQGETITDLASRVREWGGGEVPMSRARMIARTESARAYVAGEEAAWQQSEVVAGKAWLLAPQPCEFCRAIAKMFRGRLVPLDQAFLPIGYSLRSAKGNTMQLSYSDVMGPPLHPNCRCDLLPVLR